jgi:hypothetical protein
LPEYRVPTKRFVSFHQPTRQKHGDLQFSVSKEVKAFAGELVIDEVDSKVVVTVI